MSNPKKSSDRTNLINMLTRARISFTLETRDINGWRQPILLPGDRMFVFDSEGNLAGIRNHSDTDSFDEF